MSFQKHVCGYPIWVESKRREDRWVTIFKDDPKGRQIERCPGCGGRVVPWEIHTPDEKVTALHAVLIELIQAAERHLYTLAPERTEKWQALTRPAREIFGEETLTPPPWEEE